MHSMRIWSFLSAFVFHIAQVQAAPPKPLEKFEKCTFVPTDWADGDSFRIKTDTGEEHTIRLYGADCMEYHVSDESDSRRLRAQRRYFGITDAKPDSKEAIELAKEFGKAAAVKTSKLLTLPFTVHTRMRDALGDGKHKRIYAFVECADGTDLATELVKSGLARAFGVYADGPGERSADEYEETLDDFELQAAKRSQGIWAMTDWDKLPIERRAQRKEEKEDGMAMGKPALPADFKINPNLAPRDELMKMPRVKEAIANRIIETREEALFTKAEDLLRVPGIKQKTLDLIRPYLDFQQP